MTEDRVAGNDPIGEAETSRVFDMGHASGRCYTRESTSVSCKSVTVSRLPSSPYNPCTMTSVAQQVPTSLAELTALIGSAPEFAEVLNALHSGNSGAIDGAWGSSCALSIAALSANSPDHTLLVVLPGIREIDEFFDQLAEFIPVGTEIRQFPAWETLPEEHDVTDSVFAARLGAVRYLNAHRHRSSPRDERLNPAQPVVADPWHFSADTSQPVRNTNTEETVTDPSYQAAGRSHSPSIVVTCLPALLQPVPARSDIEEATRRIAVGDELALEPLLDWLIERRFDRVTAVELAGEFCVHGGVLDIFPPTEPDPIRIELFGDEVESIRSFDVESQRRLEDLGEVAIIATKPVKPHDRPEPGDSLRPHNAIASATESLLDSIPADTIVVLSDMAQAVSEGKLYLQRLANPIGMFSVNATMARLTEFPSVTIDALGADSYETSCHLKIEAVERFASTGRDALVDLTESLGPHDRVMLACHNDGEKQRLAELIAETDASAELSLSERITLCVGRVNKGFRLV